MKGITLRFKRWKKYRMNLEKWNEMKERMNIEIDGKDGQIKGKTDGMKGVLNIEESWWP